MLTITGALTALSAAVIWNAYEKKKQFYPTVVYLMNSNRAMGVLYLQAFLLVWMFAQLLKNIFFGALRAVEVEQLIEKSWFAVLETFILLAGFHQDLSVGFVAVVTILFVVKSFHSLASDRVDFMERSPLITALFHLRIVSILFILGALDLIFVQRAWISITTRGPSVDIVFGLEFAIMFTVAVNVFLKYILHTIDLQSEDPWENKTIYIRYVDIVLGFFQLVLYVGYMFFMLYILFMPLHIARRVYMAAKSVQNNIRDVVSSYHAIRNLNTLYPDATPEELNTTNNICIICREEMTQRCKKLLCGHIFHTACLRSWFQRQQTCPTCRLDVLRPTAANATRQQQQRQRAAGDQGRPGAQDVPLMFPGMWPGMVPGVIPPPQPQQRPPQPQRAPQEPGQVPEAAAQAPAGDARSGGDETREQQDGQPSAQSLPPFPPGMPTFPFMIPPPPPPPFFMAPYGGMSSDAAMRQLSDEELRQLEGMERGNVEARIAVLRNVQALLDAAVSQLNQYSAVMATMNPSGPGFPGYPPPPAGPPPSSPPGPPSSSPPQQSAGDNAASSPAKLSTPRGLFQQAQRSSSPGVISEPARPLQERQDSFAFSAGVISPTREQVTESESGVLKSKSAATPDIAVDEIRRKRLERLYSLPNTPSTDNVDSPPQGDPSKDSANPSAADPSFQQKDGK